MENVTGYVFNHHSSLFSSPPQDFPIRLGMDSECVLYSLNPLKTNKSVLVKNAVRGIHSFCQDITTKWPHVSIVFYHVATQLKCADSNSKIPSDLDPCRIMESQMWRNGLPQMMDPSRPPEQNIFLKVKNGELIWLGKNRPEPSNCIRCHNAVCGTRSCACMACVPALLGRNLSTNSSSSWMLFPS
jgi:hypothetical protein